MALSEAPVPFQKKIVEVAPNDFVHCVSECCHNLLKGNVPMTPAQKDQLHPKRQLIRMLADKKVSVNEKKKELNQQGGFLPLLAPLLAPVIAPEVGKVLQEVVKAV